jgi:hypothetical protein
MQGHLMTRLRVRLLGRLGYTLVFEELFEVLRMVGVDL